MRNDAVQLAMWLASVGLLAWVIRPSLFDRLPFRRRRPEPPLAFANEPLRQPTDLRRTPEELREMILGQTELQAHATLQPFIGRFMTVTGRVGRVSAWSEMLPFYSVLLERSDDWTGPRVGAFFRDPSDGDRLAELNTGDVITVRGTVDSVSVNAGVSLERCELVAFDSEPIESTTRRDSQP